MDVTASLDAPCPAAALFPWVAELDRYPRWLTIVTRAEPLALAADGVPAWSVDLRGRLGPLARSKRLRMVRTEHRPDVRAVFRRDEGDGRRHSEWVLDAEVAPSGTATSRLTMHLHYGGALWGPVLERLLDDEIEQSRARLVALLTAPAGPPPGHLARG